jgi:hypothetical protein
VYTYVNRQRFGTLRHAHRTSALGLAFARLTVQKKEEKKEKKKIVNSCIPDTAMGKNKKRGKGNDKAQESTRVESQAEPHTEEPTEIDAHQCDIAEEATKVAESSTKVASEAVLVREPEETPTKMPHTEEPTKMDTEAATKVETEAVLVSLPFCRFAGRGTAGEAETMATCTTDTPPGSPHVPRSETPLSKPSPTASPSWPTPHPSFHRDEAKTPPGSPRAVLSARGPRQGTFASPKQSEDAVRACIRPTIFSAHCSCIFVIRQIAPAKESRV